MKILMISSNDIGGGAASVAASLGTALRTNKIKVKYIVGKKISNSKSVYELKRTPILGKIGKLAGRDPVSLFRYARTYLLANDIDFGASSEILNHPWYKEADIVHCHNLHGNYFKLETLQKMSQEKPVVWTLHDGWALTAHCAHCYDCQKDNNGKHFTPGRNRYGADMLWDNSEYLWNKKKNIYDSSDKLTIVTPSDWLANKTKSSILNIKSIHIINNGIDTALYKPADRRQIRKELELPPDFFLIGCVGSWGRMDIKKGGEYLTQTAHRYQNKNKVAFLCIGGSSGSEVVKEQNVYIAPQTFDRTLMAKYYAACNILLYPSLAENFPLVTLEALSTGLPVVGFDVGGVKEQIQHKINGYIAKYRDLDDLLLGVEYIRTLDNGALTKMQKNNRQRAIEKYSLSTMRDKYEQLYKTII